MDTISSPNDIDALFRRGRRARRPRVVVLALCSPRAATRDGRTVFVAGKSLGGAVVRNRCKRVLRESVRSARVCWPGFDVALIATSSTARASAEDVAEDLASALREAGVLA